MQNVTLIGIDLGKHSFHVHCQDKSGKALLRKKLSRSKLMESLAGSPSATVVMEACAGAHFMARRIAAFGGQYKPRPTVCLITFGMASYRAICKEE